MRILLLILALYPAWLALLAAHEFGHVLHAWLSGGRIAHVSIPLCGFSYTTLASNPHPQFVAWGGPVWGALLPLAIPFALRATARLIVPDVREMKAKAREAPGRAARARGRFFRAVAKPVVRAALGFASLCLVANGAYLAVGQFDAVGDAGDLLRHGAPRWSLICVGTLFMIAALFVGRLATSPIELRSGSREARWRRTRPPPR